jgi:hypothetical protein
MWRIAKIGRKQLALNLQTFCGKLQILEGGWGALSRPISCIAGYGNERSILHAFHFAELLEIICK